MIGTIVTKMQVCNYFLLDSDNMLDDTKLSRLGRGWRSKGNG